MRRPAEKPRVPGGEVRPSVGAARRRARGRLPASARSELPGRGAESTAFAPDVLCGFFAARGFDEVLDPRQLLIGESRRFAAEQRRHSLGRGSLEKSVDEVPECGAPCRVPRNGRKVDVAQTFFLVLDVPLALEHAELSPHRGVAGRAIELLDDLGNGGPSETVEDVHDLSLTLGESCGMTFGSHAIFITLLRRI